MIYLLVFYGVAQLVILNVVVAFILQAFTDENTKAKEAEGAPSLSGHSPSSADLGNGVSLPPSASMSVNEKGS